MSPPKKDDDRAQVPADTAIIINTTSHHHETGFVDSNGAGGQGRGGASAAAPDLGAAAYAYAAENLYIFPLYPLGFIHPKTGKPCDGKTPATSNGFHRRHRRP